MSCIFLYTLFIFLSENFGALHKLKIIKFIDKYSFGLYLFHSSFLYPILDYGSKIDVHPMLFSLVTFVLITSVSILLTVFISNNKYLKFIIGQ